MGHVARQLFVAAAALLALCAPSASEARDCRPAAMASLRTLAPDGFAIYEQIPDKGFFLNWITCDDVQLGLSTAVHESVHFITSQRDAFPLLGGGEIRRPHEITAFFAPSRIEGRFGASDFVDTYLRPGRAASAADFLYLLDELNAYTHDLKAAMDLDSLRTPGEDISPRDGLAAAMAFVATYVETARENDTRTWAGLQKPEVAGAVSAIWGRAEGTMAASCGIPDFGTEDRTFVRRFCRPEAQNALRTILGRAPVCPTACLAARPSRDGWAD